MTETTFLASSKPFEIPDEIEEYNNKTEFELVEDFIFFNVQKIDDYWKKEVEGLFSLPYIYEANGVGNKLFLKYIEKYMDIGDVLEIYEVPNQHAFEEYKQKMQENPEQIEVNVGSYTYRDIYLKRDSQRPTHSQMGERVLILRNEFLSSETHPRFFLNNTTINLKDAVQYIQEKDDFLVT